MPTEDAAFDAGWESDMPDGAEEMDLGPETYERPIGSAPIVPKILAVRKAAEKLVEIGHSPEAANSIALAVSDPAELRRRLDNPMEHRVPGAILKTVEVMVFPQAVCPSPTNPRGLPGWRYPAGFQQCEDFRRPLAQRPDINGRPSLRLEVENCQHLLWAMEESLAYLKRENDYSDSIKVQGVLRSVILVPTRVVHTEEARPDFVLLTTADGSSRTASTWEILGIRHERLYDQLGNERSLRNAIASTIDLFGRDERSLKPEDVYKMRVTTIPATLIVGFHPEPGSDVDFARAVESMVAMIHVEPPKPWKEAAKLDTKANSVVQELQRHGALLPVRAEWYSGMLRPEQAVNAGIRPELDVRAAEIFRLIDSTKFKKVVNKGLRRLEIRNTRPSRAQRLEAAVELMIRPYRADLSEREEVAARRGLLDVLQASEMNSDKWRISTRTPEQLCDEALKDLASQGCNSMAGRELGVLAAYWMARYGVLRHGIDRADRREPNVIFRQLMSSAHGIKVLYQALVDGRAGREPRAVRDDGTPSKSASGEEIPLSDRWLRENWPPTSGQPQPPTPPAGGASGAYLAAMTGLRDAVDQVKQALERFRQAGPSGKAIGDTEGLPPDFVQEMNSSLTDILTKVARYSAVYEAKHGQDESPFDFDQEYVADDDREAAAV